MKACKLLIFLVLVSAKTYGQSIVGVWQRGTAVVGSGYQESYTFKANKTFEYRANEEDGLQRVSAIGGTYTYAKGQLALHVTYTIELVGGTIDRSTITTGNDSWSIEGGKLVRIPITKPSWFGIEVKFLSSAKATFNMNEYYKVAPY